MARNETTLHRIDIADVEFIGTELNRPECSLATKSGHLCVADVWAGISIIDPNGNIETIRTLETDFTPHPNGISILAYRSFVLAHLGDSDGGVYRLHRDGRVDPFLFEIDCAAIQPTNYVQCDTMGQTWMIVSTLLSPRVKSCHRDNADGYIILADDKVNRIVADGLGFTNECVDYPNGKWLYVNTTFQKRLRRFGVYEQGALSNKSKVAKLGVGTFLDGLTFEVEGGVWITSIVSNRVIRITLDGE